MNTKSILKTVIGSAAAGALIVFLQTTTIQTRDSVIQKLKKFCGDLVDSNTFPGLSHSCHFLPIFANYFHDIQ